MDSGRGGLPDRSALQAMGRHPRVRGPRRLVPGSTSTEAGAERLAETVGETVAANLGSKPVVAPPADSDDGSEDRPGGVRRDFDLHRGPHRSRDAPVLRSARKDRSGERGRGHARGALWRLEHCDRPDHLDRAREPSGPLRRRRPRIRSRRQRVHSVQAPRRPAIFQPRGLGVREVVRRQDRNGRYGYGGVQSRAEPGAWARVGTAKRGDVGTQRLPVRHLL